MHTNANSRKVSAPSFSTSKMEKMRVFKSDSVFHNSTGERNSSQNTRAESRPCDSDNDEECVTSDIGHRER